MISHYGVYNKYGRRFIEWNELIYREYECLRTGRASVCKCSYYIFYVPGIKCPVCAKFVLPDDIECHLVMCLTKPRLSYNGANSILPLIAVVDYVLCVLKCSPILEYIFCAVLQTPLALIFLFIAAIHTMLLD
jgi:hypothetical protein